MTKNCIVCGRPFDGNLRKTICGPECAHQRQLESQARCCAKCRAIRAQQEAERQRVHTIQQVMAMAAARGISYGKMVQILEREAAK